MVRNGTLFKFCLQSLLCGQKSREIGQRKFHLMEKGLWICPIFWVEFSTWKTMLDIRRGVLKVVFVNGLFGQFNGDSRAIFKTLKIIQIRQKMTELPDFLSSVLEKQCQCQICPLNMAKITRTFLLFHFIHWTGLAERFCWQTH